MDLGKHPHANGGMEPAEEAAKKAWQELLLNDCVEIFGPCLGPDATQELHPDIDHTHVEFAYKVICEYWPWPEYPLENEQLELLPDMEQDRYHDLVLLRGQLSYETRDHLWRSFWQGHATVSAKGPGDKTEKERGREFTADVEVQRRNSALCHDADGVTGEEKKELCNVDHRRGEPVNKKRSFTDIASAIQQETPSSGCKEYEDSAVPNRLDSDSPTSACPKMMEAPQHIEVESHPARHFLELLGKNPDRAWFRTVVPRKGSNRSRSGRDLHGLDIAALEADNKAGASIYFVTGNADQASGTNKAGAATGCVCDVDVHSCGSVFVEWDDHPIDWQLTAWQGLGLPEPSLMVNSGGKSIQCYWVLSKPMAPDQWEVLQRRLIEYAGGDQKCKNPSRLMRLPGFWYVDKGTGTVTNRVAELIYQADVSYSAAEIEACLVEPAPAPQSSFALALAEALADFSDLPPRSEAELLEALKLVPEFFHDQGRRDELLGLAQRLTVEWGEDRAQQWLEGHSPSVLDMAGYFSSKPDQISPGSIWPFLRERYGLDLTRHDLKRSKQAVTNKAKPKGKASERKPKKLSHERRMACFERCVQIQAKRERNGFRRRVRLWKAAKDLELHTYMNRAEIAQRVLEAKEQQQGHCFVALSAEDRVRMSRPVIRWLVPELLPEGDLTILGGRPKVGKTRVAMAITAAVLEGNDCIDFGSPAQPIPVVLITDDQADGDTHQMLEALQLWSHPRLIWSRHFRLTEHDLDALLETIKANPGALVVLDSLRSISRSLQAGENDPEIGATLYDLKQAVIDTGGTLLLVHHCNKGPELVGTEALSGHNAIAGAANTVLTLHYCPDVNGKPDKESSQRRLVREARSGSGCDLVIDRRGAGLFRQVMGFSQWQQQLAQARQEEQVLERATDTQRALLDWLQIHPGEWYTRRELVEGLGLKWEDKERRKDGKRVQESLNRLASTGFVLISQGGGNTLRYSLASRDTQKGISSISPTSPTSDTKGSA